MNDEEKSLSEAYDRRELELEEPSSELQQMLAAAGENTFKKDKRINIRLSSHDLIAFKHQVAHGILLELLGVTSLLHVSILG